MRTAPGARKVEPDDTDELSSLASQRLSRNTFPFILSVLLAGTKPAWPPQPPGPGPQAASKVPTSSKRHSEVGNAANEVVRHSLESAVLGHCIAFSGVSKERGAVSVQLKQVKIRVQKNPDFPLKTAHRQTDRQRTSRPSGPPLPRRKFASRVRALPPAPTYTPAAPWLAPDPARRSSAPPPPPPKGWVRRCDHDMRRPARGTTVSERRHSTPQFRVKPPTGRSRK
eukprot:gene24599-biopygen11916